MNEWYVYQASGDALGPWTADVIAAGIATGKVPRDAHVAQRGDTQWRALFTVQEITGLLQRLEASKEAVPAPAQLGTIPPQPTPPVEEFGRDVTQRRGPALLAATPDNVAMFAPAAAAQAQAPQPQQQPQVQPQAPKEEKKEEKKQLDPKYKMMPYIIFGACAAVSLLLVVIAFATGTIGTPPPTLDAAGVHS